MVAAETGGVGVPDCRRRLSPVRPRCSNSDLRRELGEVNADEALVGLMALHLLDGEWSTFFWGQSYGGTIDVILLAPVVARLGATRVALQVISMLQSIVATILVWSVARRIRTGSRPAGGRPRRA